jgi:predicted glycoside hydrolase/deacetylase ChbG (UPF0249 family)
MAGIQLIVRGDNLGLSHAADQAIEEAFETGVLTCASLATAGPWVAEAAGLVHLHPAWEIGLQLQLHSPAGGCRWGPVAGPAAVPSLVEPAGHFPPTVPAAATPDDVLRELAAQVERARAWNVHPAYLEYASPPHPAVTAALERLSEESGVPAGMTSQGLGTLLLPPGSLSAVTLLDALQRLSPGTYLWVTHPAAGSPETWSLWGEDETPQLQEREARVLTDPALVTALAKQGIELIGFRRHLETRRRAETSE